MTETKEKIETKKDRSYQPAALEKKWQAQWEADKLYRAVIDETRQRLNRSADERAATDKANFIAALLPVMDDLNRAIDAVSENTSRDSLLEGIRSIATSFQAALTSAGVEPSSRI